ncbi:hypothetical protein BB560_007275 [Smittium megazygosporum]|uniref:UDP-N-acetylglucosamine diphosphorylase n=1 Tax=Smittium megazygosporum TaxID=133381 RepID=A0A2T9XXD4_9FUNG|nr:hypothetical protein BB560_007275 [Smittium megazygosporum]
MNPEMVPEERLSALKQRYSAVGQEHIFGGIESLSEEKLSDFIKTLEDLEIETITENFKKAIESESLIDTSQALEPLDDSEYASQSKGDPKKTLEWYNEGLSRIAASEVAAIVMAGGQGTRLGSSLPKGCYKVGTPSDKSLFAIQADRILGLESLAAKHANIDRSKVRIFWLVMVSEATRSNTVDYFEQMNYFGLQKDQVMFFDQGSVPSFTFDGKLIMRGVGEITVSPDGNGGIYKGLITSDAYKVLKQNNVKYFHVYSVDNILVRVADPWFIGYSVFKRAEYGALVLSKQSWDEKVGVICKANGKYKVVEYSELSEKLAQLTRADGSLYYNAANICIQFFTMDFLDKTNEFNSKLPFHIAKKKINYFDYDSGQIVVPTKPNGIKLERFIFDVFPFCSKVSILDVDRSEAFSPLKNAPGAGSDCPETCRNDLMSLHIKFAENAGATVQGDARLNFEISHKISYFGEGLEALKGRIFLEKTILE